VVAVEIEDRRAGTTKIFFSQHRLCLSAQDLACQPKPEPALALSSQRWVWPSVQPGIAKLVGAWPDTGNPWCVRQCIRGRSERCAGAALADVHKPINKPKAKTEAKTDRIASTPTASCMHPLSSKCARAATAPSCDSFTIGHIVGIGRAPVTSKEMRDSGIR
jgi:hypothetical protein